MIEKLNLLAFIYGNVSLNCKQFQKSVFWTIKRAKQNEAKTFLETLMFLFIFRFEKVFESQT